MSEVWEYLCTCGHDYSDHCHSAHNGSDDIENCVCNVDGCKCNEFEAKESAQ